MSKRKSNCWQPDTDLTSTPPGSTEPKEKQRTFTEDELKAFVVKLRKKHTSIEEKRFFCNNHNFNLEAEAKKSQSDVVMDIIHEMQKDFDLGFVWDESLND